MDVSRVMPGGRPEDKDAELALLGCVFLEPHLLQELDVKPSDFYSAACATVWAAFLALVARGATPDVVTVNGYLEAEGTLERVGGTPFLARAMDSVPTAANAEWFARAVVRNRQSRSLLHATARIAEVAHSPLATTQELFGEAERLLFDVTQSDGGVDEPADSHQLAQEMFDRWDSFARGETQHAIPTGFPHLDGLLGGLTPGELVLLAGRPSMGKSSLGNRMVRNLAQAGYPVGMFSLEVPRYQVTANILAAETGVATKSIQTGMMAEGERASVLAALDDFDCWPLRIHDSPYTTLQELATISRRMVRRHGVRAIFLDYLQLLGVSEPELQRASRYDKVSHISASLKRLARELEVPVVALAMLSRKNEERKDKKPMMSDLKESGSLEQDADAVLLIHREEYYNPTRDNDGQAELFVAKNRNGATGKVALLFSKSCMRFDDAPPEMQPAEARPDGGRPAWLPPKAKWTPGQDRPQED